MIRGIVNSAFDAVVRLPIRGSSGRTREVEAAIDTGFNGSLTLPAELAEELKLPFITTVAAFLANGEMVRLNVYRVELLWDGRTRYIRADATGKRPLVGMSLLHRQSLYLEVVEGGRVEIQAQG